jgi:hypothetical protein
MHFAIVDSPSGSQGKPYRFYKFRSLASAHKCPEVTEFALVYESLDQLKQLCPADDIRAILIAVGETVPTSISHEMLATGLHKLVEQNATTWSSEKAEEATQEEEPDMATAKKAKKTAKTKTATAKAKKPAVKKVAEKKERKVPLKTKATGKMESSGKIKVLAANPARKGTHRYENLEVIFGSKTVEEALHTLRNMTPKGGMLDIRFAVANKLIEVSNG